MFCHWLAPESSDLTNSSLQYSKKAVLRPMLASGTGSLVYSRVIASELQVGVAINGNLSNGNNNNHTCYKRWLLGLGENIMGKLVGF